MLRQNSDEELIKAVFVRFAFLSSGDRAWYLVCVWLCIGEVEA